MYFVINNKIQRYDALSNSCFFRKTTQNNLVRVHVRSPPPFHGREFWRYPVGLHCIRSKYRAFMKKDMQTVGIGIQPDTNDHQFRKLQLLYSIFNLRQPFEFYDKQRNYTVGIRYQCFIKDFVEIRICFEVFQQTIFRTLCLFGFFFSFYILLLYYFVLSFVVLPFIYSNCIAPYIRQLLT